MLCHGLQDIVSRRSAAMYPTEPSSFSASEVTVRMGRIRHTLPVLLLFRTMTPAFPTAFMRLIAPRLVPIHVARHIALNLVFHHNTLPPFP